MRVFVTGAAGWVGSVVVAELAGTGHRVTGLAHSDEKAPELAAEGAEVLRATLDDLDIPSHAASETDAVNHLGFDHDVSNAAENAEQDRRAVVAMGGALEGTDTPLTDPLIGLGFPTPETGKDPTCQRLRP